MGNYYVGERVIVFILVFMDRFNTDGIIMGVIDFGWYAKDYIWCDISMV